MKSNGEGWKNTARLEAKGFEQRPGYEYQEVFSPIARIKTIRLLIVFVTQKHWKIYQMDVKLAFLNGPLEKEVFVMQPPVFMK